MASIKAAPELRASPAPLTDEAATLSPNQARQAVKLGTMRYVLAISMIAVVIALAVAFFVVR
jgi:hypothetical protein